MTALVEVFLFWLLTSSSLLAVRLASATMLLTRSRAMSSRVTLAALVAPAAAEVDATGASNVGASNVGASMLTSSSLFSSSRIVSSQLPLESRRKQVPALEAALLTRFFRCSDCVSDFGMQASAPLSVDGADDVGAEAVARKE